MSENNNPTAVRKVIDGAIGLGKGAGSLVRTIVKGNTWYQRTQGKNYNIMFDTSKSCVVGIFDKTRPRSWSSRSGEPGLWIFRLDRAHGKTDYSHINLNKKITGFKDPHLKLPPGGLEVGKATAKTLQALNTCSDILTYAAIVGDLYTVGSSAAADYYNGTTRNTVETVAKVGGEAAGGFLGATAGATIGSFILPGPGTMFFGFIGAVGGSVYGRFGTISLSKLLGDLYQYDIKQEECKCGTSYTVHRYKGETVEKLCSEQCKPLNALSLSWLADVPVEWKILTSHLFRNIQKSNELVWDSYLFRNRQKGE